MKRLTSDDFVPLNVIYNIRTRRDGMNMASDGTMRKTFQSNGIDEDDARPE